MRTVGAWQAEISCILTCRALLGREVHVVGGVTETEQRSGGHVEGWATCNSKCAVQVIFVQRQAEAEAED